MRTGISVHEHRLQSVTSKCGHAEPVRCSRVPENGFEDLTEGAGSEGRLRGKVHGLTWRPPDWGIRLRELRFIHVHVW